MAIGVRVEPETEQKQDALVRSMEKAAALACGRPFRSMCSASAPPMKRGVSRPDYRSRRPRRLEQATSQLG